MPLNTNWWNKIRYTFYVPIYDWVAKVFYQSRKLNIAELNIKSGERVLIVGGGTGLDIEFIPDNCEIVATDITPAMVSKMRKRPIKANQHLSALIMDGQKLDFDDCSFDKIILHLIVAVIPDAQKCIYEAERVLKEGGKVSVFDKFVRKGDKPSFARKFANVFTAFLFSNIDRDIYALINGTHLKVKSDIDANLNGFMRRLILYK